ncbi:hypothetical protein HID58_078473, partial [Brassica napus]
NSFHLLSKKQKRKSLSSTLWPDGESKVLIAERDGLVGELMKSIRRDSDSSLIEATLSCLIAISSPRRVKLNLIREKLIKDLTKLLTDPTTASVSMTEKSLKLLESLASTKEGRSENCGGDGECLKTVVKKLMKVSTAATEHAVTVIWSVSYLFTDPQASVSVMEKYLKLLKSLASTKEGRSEICGGDDGESKVLIAERDGLVGELMKSIRRDSDSSLIEATLSCLIAISSPRRVKLNLIREKLIKDLTKLLTDPTTASVSMTEKSLKLLESLASTKEGRSENCGGDGECLKTVVKKLMKVSTAATEHAVTVIWSVSYLFTDPQASVSVMEKYLKLLKSLASTKEGRSEICGGDGE